MKFPIAFAFFLPLIQSKQLFTLLGEESSRQVSRCHDKFYLNCEKVQLDLDVLLKETNVEFPHGLTLTRFGFL